MGLLDSNFFRFFGFKKKPNAPWSKYYPDKAMDLVVPDISIYDCFYEGVKKWGDKYAVNYYGTRYTYSELNKKVLDCSLAFLSYGIRKGDVVTICMPNTPEGVIAFLALFLI